MKRLHWGLQPFLFAWKEPMSLSPRLLFRIARFLCLLAAFGVAMVSRAGSRDFAGFYDLSDVVVSGNQHYVTVTIRIRNYAETDLAGGRVVVACAADTGKMCGAFDAVNMRRGGIFKGRAIFLVGAEDAQNWLKSAPSFVVSDVDSMGHAEHGKLRCCSSTWVGK